MIAGSYKSRLPHPRRPARKAPQTPLFGLRALQHEDRIVAVSEPQHEERALLQHVRIDRVRSQETDALVERLPFAMDEVARDRRLADLLRQAEIGDQPALALDGVIGEIAEQQRSDNRRHRMPGATLENIADRHRGESNHMRDSPSIIKCLARAGAAQKMTLSG